MLFWECVLNEGTGESSFSSAVSVTVISLRETSALKLTLSLGHFCSDSRQGDRRRRQGADGIQTSIYLMRFSTVHTVLFCFLLLLIFLVPFHPIEDILMPSIEIGTRLIVP